MKHAARINTMQNMWTISCAIYLGWCARSFVVSIKLLMRHDDAWRCVSNRFKLSTNHLIVSCVLPSRHRQSRSFQRENVYSSSCILRWSSPTTGFDLSSMSFFLEEILRTRSRVSRLRQVAPSHGTFVVAHQLKIISRRVHKRTDSPTSNKTSRPIHFSISYQVEPSKNIHPLLVIDVLVSIGY